MTMEKLKKKNQDKKYINHYVILLYFFVNQ